MVSGAVLQARLRPVDDALAERLDPLPAGALSFHVALAAEHQKRLDRLVELAVLADLAAQSDEVMAVASTVTSWVSAVALINWRGNDLFCCITV